MSQLSDHPDLDQIREADQAATGVLTAESRGLIDGQYADRPHLRPVLDAVLAALPGLGPVTVQVRTTLVSLVTPRRTIGEVRATTKNRVDLGVRLDTVRPGGRLLAAGTSARHVRIGSPSPGDLDEQALGWLRRARGEHRPAAAAAASPAPGTESGAAHRRDRGLRPAWPDLRAGPRRPGYHDIHVALTEPGKDRRGPAGPGEDGPTLVVPGSPGWRPTGARRRLVGPLGGNRHRAP